MGLGPSIVISYKCKEDWAERKSETEKRLVHGAATTIGAILLLILGQRGWEAKAVDGNYSVILEFSTTEQLHQAEEQLKEELLRLHRVGDDGSVTPILEISGSSLTCCYPQRSEWKIKFQESGALTLL